MRSVVLLLLLLAFLGGYYLGHMDNSPDLFRWLGQTRAERTNFDKHQPKPMAVEVGGKTYVVGQKYASEFSKD